MSVENNTGSSIAPEEDDEDDVFVDAPEIPFDLTLQQSIEQAGVAMRCYFNNQFDEAKSLMQPFSDISVYHAIGNATMVFIEAILTFEKESIAEASKILTKAINVCKKQRKKFTVTDFFGKFVNFQSYKITEIEAHAELCYADCLLLKSLLTFVEDESMGSFIRGALRVRSCHITYKECYNILEKRDWSRDKTKSDFACGVNLGLGTFELMLSMLPPRIMKLVEIIGFSANRNSGLEKLRKGYYYNGGLRKVMCALSLLSYYLIICYDYSSEHISELGFCEEIINDGMETYPQGMWFHFFKGRLELVQGNLGESMEWYGKSLRSQESKLHYQSFCYWELYWVNCLLLNWEAALENADNLLRKNKWSITNYVYQKAAALIMLDHEKHSDAIRELMGECPKHKQRIAGKSIPAEKFVIQKAKRYFDQDEYLILPVLEMVYVSNLFKTIAMNEQLGEAYLELLDGALVEVERVFESRLRFLPENRAILLLMKGSCCRHLRNYDTARDALLECMGLKALIVEDTYIVPYCLVEYGLMLMELGNYEEAEKHFEDARKNYTGYQLESRLHFYVHSAMVDVKLHKHSTAQARHAKV